MSASNSNYADWSTDKLIDRISSLERELAKLRTNATGSLPNITKGGKKHKDFDPSKYSTRFIALKFAYLGRNYNGFEHHANNQTPLPTVEETVWKALFTARLISPNCPQPLANGEISWEGCEYSKCGRTDKGVSAFGQVIGIRVRSNRPLASRNRAIANESEGEDPPASDERDSEDIEASFDPIRDEISYPQVLNRLLPPDIRVLAWCPAPPPEFSARFSCRERRYRYFFTQPAFNPTPTGSTDPLALQREGWLDLQKMKEAAKKFEGLHDFRNFCKIDASKQITDFRRRIFHCDIEEIKGLRQPAGSMCTSPFGESSEAVELSENPLPKTYAFVVHGSAFLWHQVRHMVAMVFLVGQGLEPAEAIDRLLDIEQNPGKPYYDMADETPLVLWDCIFPEEGGDAHQDALQWMSIGESVKGRTSTEAVKKGGLFLLETIWSQWRDSKINEILTGSLLNESIRYGLPPSDLAKSLVQGDAGPRVFQGGNTSPYRGKYVPLFERRRMPSPEVLNKKYLQKMESVKADAKAGTDS